MVHGSQAGLVGRLVSLAEPVLAELDLELVELEFQREANGWILRLTIDTESGVTVDHCARVSRELGAIIEVEDLIDQAFHLEVSSPGLNRPLKKEEDFSRFQGRKAKVTTHEPLAKQQVFTGVIEKAGSGIISLATDAGTVDIPFANIAKARLEIDF